MKNLCKTKFCLDLQVEHFPNEIFVHQSIYTEKVLKHFHMNKAYSLNTRMVDWSLDIKNDHFSPSRRV